VNGRTLCRTRWWVGMAVLLAGLAACSGNEGTDSSSGAAVGTIAGPAAPDGAAAPGATKQPADSTADLRLEPALIRTAELSVVVRNVPDAAGEAAAAARSAGGAVAGDDRSGGHATLVLKVPPDRLDPVLDRLARLGTEQSRSSSSKDVTEDVADVGARVASMQASIARVRAILSRADKIGDVVSVEGELSRRTTELESLQARQRALAGQVGYATITVQLRATPAAAAAPAPDRGGFVGGLADGWHAFVVTVGWLLAVLGAVLPFLLVAVPAALAVRWALRRRGPAASAAASAPAPQPE
jgi:Domain of unknown function (DUF4349)